MQLDHRPVLLFLLMIDCPDHDNYSAHARNQQCVLFVIAMVLEEITFYFLFIYFFYFFTKVRGSISIISCVVHSSRP